MSYAISQWKQCYYCQSLALAVFAIAVVLSAVGTHEPENTVEHLKRGFSLAPLATRLCGKTLFVCIDRCTYVLYIYIYYWVTVTHPFN